MDAWRTFLALSLMVVGCSDVLPRDAMIAEQRRIESAVQMGTSAEEARQALVSFGYTCHEAEAPAVSTDGAANGSKITDCVKAVKDKAEMHVCLRQTPSEVKDVRYGLRPLCGS